MTYYPSVNLKKSSLLFRNNPSRTANPNRNKASWPWPHVGFTATQVRLRGLSNEGQSSVEQQAISAEQTEPCLIRIARYAKILPMSYWLWPKSRWLAAFRQQGLSFINLGSVIISRCGQHISSYFFEDGKNGLLTQIIHHQLKDDQAKQTIQAF